MGLRSYYQQLLIALLLSCATVEATITATDRGVGSDGSSVNSITISPGSGMSAGSTGILFLSIDNSNAASSDLTATSWTDSAGNVWTDRQTSLGGAVANSTVEGHLIVSYLDNAITPSTTITIPLVTNTPSKTWAWIEASSSLTNGQVLFVFSAINGFSAQTAPSVTTTASTDPAVGDLYVGLAGGEYSDTWTPVTGGTNGTWSAGQHTGVGTTTSGASILTQNKIFTAKVAGVYNPTLTPAADGRIGFAVFTEADTFAKTTGGNAVSETTSVWTFNKPLAAGTMGILCLAADNNGTSGTTTNVPSTLTDSRSNTWTRQQTAIRNISGVGTGVEMGIYTCVPTTSLVIGDTVSCVFPVAVSAKTSVVLGIPPTGAGVMTYVTGGAGPGATGATGTYTTGSITSGDYVVGVYAAEAMDNLTGDSDTTNGTWRPDTTQTRGSTLATSVSIMAQVKKVTATATQTFDVVSGDGSVDNVQGWVSIHDSSPTGPTNPGAFLPFFLP